MLAVAALLWMVYLVPTWFKRREYLTTERNAVRLQQTLRVLAETEEIPDVARSTVRVEPPAARPVVRQAPAAALRRQRIRRGRAVSSMFLLASLVATIAQVSLILSTGVAVGSYVVIAAAILAGGGSLAMLSKLAEQSRAEHTIAAPAVAPPAASRVPTAPVVERRAGWTPVPVPKPLYLDRATPTQVFATETVEQLQAAAASAERALRAAHASPEVVPITRPSRFASMGIIDVPKHEQPDIDAVLRRRRAAAG